MGRSGVPSARDLGDGRFEVPLTQGRTATVDAADWILINDRFWHASCTADGNWYAAARHQKDGRWTAIKMHTIITGLTLIDHIDGNGLNNCRNNLRPATTRENGANCSRKRISNNPYKGIQRSGSRWEARIGGRPIQRLGSFATAEEAARAYDRAAREQYGAYARLNFPDPEETS